MTDLRNLITRDEATDYLTTVQGWSIRRPEFRHSADVRRLLTREQAAEVLAARADGEPR